MNQHMLPAEVLMRLAGGAYVVKLANGVTVSSNGRLWIEPQEFVDEKELKVASELTDGLYSRKKDSSNSG